MRPLAEELRPQRFGDIVGQDHLVGNEGFITRLIKKNVPLSIILWGPPGCGKTSIARLYAKAFAMQFVSMSAIFSGVADLKQIIKEAKQHPLLNKGTLLFVDEIHRFNKAQQDAFLPHIEDGTITLVGATTENPSFHLNNALLSRVRVLTLNPLQAEDLETIIQKYEEEENPLNLTEEAREDLISLAQGDGRYLLNLIENLKVADSDQLINSEELQKLLQKRASLFDRDGEQHYNLISALHKAVRGSDHEAALYWFCRMLEGGEDPLFLARRLIRMASEDIGLADTEALKLAVAAKEAYQMLGSPEGELALAEVVVYLALAPKSNSLYKAFKSMKEIAGKTTHKAPPNIILNAPTQLMKELDYGKGYQYDHDTPHGFSGQNYFPDGIERPQIYTPVERGFERDLIKRIDYFKKLRDKIGTSK